MSSPPTLHPPESIEAFRIAPDDTVVLGIIHDPTPTYDVSVCFEIWQPGGAQPWNSHTASVETFLVLAGEGRAESDEHTAALRPGVLLVLPPGSRHRIVNTGDGPLCTITTMTPDDGFAELIRAGTPVALDDEELDVLRARLPQTAP